VGVATGPPGIVDLGLVRSCGKQLPYASANWQNRGGIDGCRGAQCQKARVVSYLAGH